MNLLLLTTGGTIDGADLDAHTYSEKSFLQETLARRADLNLETRRLLNKDSREITDEDRNLICATIQETEQAFVLIGHGTFTICETGAYLKRHLKAGRRTILLVGAWLSFEEPHSDAPQQIQNALKAFHQIPEGVYVAMDGRLWNPTVTRKEKTGGDTWRFVSSEPSIVIE